MNSFVLLSTFRNFALNLKLKTNKVMAIKVTSDGIISVPKWEGFLGTEASIVFQELSRSCHCKRINDSIGIRGFRHLTLTNSIWRIELICESKEAEDFLSKRIAPSETDWLVIDIFLYHKKRDDAEFPYK